MKTLRLIGTTLLLVVLCLNFTACSDDDDDEQPETNTNKLIKRLVTDYGDGDIETETFKYDNSGRVIEYRYSFPGEGEELHVYTYKENEIVSRVTWNDELHPTNSEEYIVRYSLINNRIVSEENSSRYGSKYTYTYNSNNQLQTKTDVTHSSQWEYSWADGNLIQEGDKYSKATYDYNSHKNETNLDINGIINDEGLAGFFGTKSINLVDKEYYDGELRVNYQYEFDNNGNLIKVIATEDDGDKYTTMIEYE